MQDMQGVLHTRFVYHMQYVLEWLYTSGEKMAAKYNLERSGKQLRKPKGATIRETSYAYQHPEHVFIHTIYLSHKLCNYI